MSAWWGVWLLACLIGIGAILARRSIVRAMDQVRNSAYASDHESEERTRKFLNKELLEMTKELRHGLMGTAEAVTLTNQRIENNEGQIKALKANWKPKGKGRTQPQARRRK